jgi:hypothetical protein
MKNIGNIIFGGQQLVINYSSICVISLLESVETTIILIKVHKTKIDGQKYETNFDCPHQVYSMVFKKLPC